MSTDVHPHMKYTAISGVPEDFTKILDPFQPFPLVQGDPHPFKKGSIAFDNETGAIIHLQDATGAMWAGDQAPLAQFEYRTHSTTEYNDFFNNYAQKQDGKIPGYFPQDFGKPGLFNEIRRSLFLLCLFGHCFVFRSVVSFFFLISCSYLLVSAFPSCIFLIFVCM